MKFKMTRADMMSFLAFSFAVLCYVMSRDISGNMFLCTVFIIQGLKSSPTAPEHHWDRIYLLCTLVAIGLLLFSVFSFATGIKFVRPLPW